MNQERKREKKKNAKENTKGKFAEKRKKIPTWNQKKDGKKERKNTRKFLFWFFGFFLILCTNIMWGN